MTPPPSKPMTKGEREELKRLARERARVAKADAERRAADLKALFEIQMNEQYEWDTVERWNDASITATDIAAKAQEEIREKFVEIGIPEAMAPPLNIAWHSRGRYMNARESLIADVPAACYGCGTQSESRPLGQTPQDWKRGSSARTASFTGNGRYWCPTCWEAQRDMPGVSRGR